MSEYIVKGAEPNETVLHRRTPNGYGGWSWLPVREEIVRCRDCERQWVFDLSNMYGTHEHDQMYCALTAGHSRLVTPDGFCAWGERRAE